MSKLGCTCGHVISDVEYPCRTEGAILRQQDESAYETASVRVASFLEATASGERDAWVKRHFSEGYPSDLSNEAVISDLIVSAFNPVSLSVAECSQCGRLWVQCAPGENRYLSFAPDEPGYHALLANTETSQQS